MQVIKRNGKLEDFNKENIIGALKRHLALMMMRF